MTTPELASDQPLYRRSVAENGAVNAEDAGQLHEAQRALTNARNVVAMIDVMLKEPTPNIVAALRGFRILAADAQDAVQRMDPDAE